MNSFNGEKSNIVFGVKAKRILIMSAVLIIAVVLPKYVFNGIPPEGADTIRVSEMREKVSPVASWSPPTVRDVEPIENGELSWEFETEVLPDSWVVSEHYLQEYTGDYKKIKNHKYYCEKLLIDIDSETKVLVTLYVDYGITESSTYWAGKVSRISGSLISIGRSTPYKYYELRSHDVKRPITMVIYCGENMREDSYYVGIIKTIFNAVSWETEDSAGGAEAHEADSN